MHVKQLPQLARLAAGMPAYLRGRVGPAMARRQIADRLSRRHERFIEMMQRLIFERPESPYARLLNRARLGPDELMRLVKQVGIEPTLEHLRDRGVYVTLDEMRGRIPIRRGDLVIELDARGLRNPLLGGSLPGRSSGTRSAGTEVAYTWAFLEEEAATECLLYEMHGVGSTPAAMWLPGPPGIAGLHNLLLHLKTGRPPARWFSHTPVPRGPVRRPAGWRWPLFSQPAAPAGCPHRHQSTCRSTARSTRPTGSRPRAIWTGSEASRRTRARQYGSPPPHATRASTSRGVSSSQAVSP